MNHSDKLKAIQFIRPDAEFTLLGDKLNWLDKNQNEPTNDEIQFGWIAYQNKIENEAAEAATARAALLAKLGITEEEARLLLGGN